jgi:hypothetical protein
MASTNQHAFKRPDLINALRLSDLQTAFGFYPNDPTQSRVFVIA